jgi:hypothetical protein
VVALMGPVAFNSKIVKHPNFQGLGDNGQHTLYVQADTFGPDGAGLFEESAESNNLYGPHVLSVR